MNGGCQFRLGHHAAFVRLHADNAGQIAHGRCANVDVVENVVQYVLLSVEEVANLENHRRRVRRHALNLHGSNDGVNVVVGNGAGQMRILGHFGSYALLAHFYGFAFLVPLEPYHLVGIVDAFVGARFVQLHRNLLQFVGNQERFSQQVYGQFQVYRIALADDIHHSRHGQ